MNVTLVFLGMALLGADGAPGPEAPLIQYQVRILEMNGLGWRESLYTRLHPVARQGSATIWTADREMIKALGDRAGRVMMSPRVAAAPDALAFVSHLSARKVASQLTRHADGPFDHAVAVAYTPDLEEVRDGYQFAFSGRKLDQGILTRVVVDETRVTAIHQVSLTEVVAAKDKQGEAGKITPQLDVPEVVKTALHGEWLIPDGGVLVVSLGAHTIDDGKGKAVVRERLMLVGADQSPARVGAGFDRASGRAITLTIPGQAPGVNLPMPVPAMPSRSLPQGRSVDGTPVALPPLPEEPSPPSSLPGTSEPCATPQTKSRPESPTIDSDSTRASLEVAPKDLVKGEPTNPATGTPARPFVFRLPLSAGVTIEIRASVLPLAKP